MAQGQYDEIASEIRERVAAGGVVLLILNGDKGSGFSVDGTAELTRALPDLLENLASQIRADIEQGRNVQ